MSAGGFEQSTKEALADQLRLFSSRCHSFPQVRPGGGISNCARSWCRLRALVEPRSPRVRVASTLSCPATSRNVKRSCILASWRQDLARSEGV